MTPSTSFNPSSNLAVLLQSPPKCGKTTILLQFPSLWIADCDDNLAGAVRYLKSTGTLPSFSYSTINRIEPQKDVRATIPELGRRWELLLSECQLAIKDPSIQTIGIDSLTSVCDYLCSYILWKKPAGKDKDQMTIGDWIPFRMFMSQFVTALKQSGKILVMTCHEQYIEQTDGTPVYTVNIPSDRLRASFSGLFTDYWRLEVSNLGRHLRCTTESATKPFGNSLNLPSTWKFDKADFLNRISL